ncbi:unnamed protein product [Amoebophrya sp. A120]|nr:unnamed protein product [Amoebophrya sp. A120]|eukprot:GSA120T00005541001.1
MAAHNMVSSVVPATQNAVEFGYLYRDPPEDIRQLTRYYFPSKIGGKPAWLVPENYPTDLTCARCGSRMRFLLQIYASREDASPAAFHRMLYVFTCRVCPDQFRCFRAQLPRLNPYYLPDNPNNFPSVSHVMDLYRHGSWSKGTKEPNDLAMLSEYEIDAEADSSTEEEGTSSDDEVDLAAVLQDRRDKELFREYQEANGNVQVFPTTAEQECATDSTATVTTTTVDHSSFQKNGNGESTNSSSTTTTATPSSSAQKTKIKSSIGAKDLSTTTPDSAKGEQSPQLDASEMAYFEEWKKTHGRDDDPAFRMFKKECLRRPRCILRVVIPREEEDDEEIEVEDENSGSEIGCDDSYSCRANNNSPASAVLQPSPLPKRRLSAPPRNDDSENTDAISALMRKNFLPATRTPPPAGSSNKPTISATKSQEAERKEQLVQNFEVQRIQGCYIQDRPSTPQVPKTALGVDGKSPNERLKEAHAQRTNSTPSSSTLVTKARSMSDDGALSRNVNFLTTVPENINLQQPPTVSGAASNFLSNVRAQQDHGATRTRSPQTTTSSNASSPSRSRRPAHRVPLHPTRQQVLENALRENAQIPPEELITEKLVDENLSMTTTPARRGPDGEDVPDGDDSSTIVAPNSGCSAGDRMAALSSITTPEDLILWYHEKDKENTRPDRIPPCRRCGAPRAFEFQLLPSMIAIANTHHDFGTVLFYTCTANCSATIDGVSYSEEYGYVQSEPPELLAQGGGELGPRAHTKG